MATLTLTDQKAKELYPKAAPEFKALLEENFGKKFFLKKAIERITSYEDACEDLDIDPVDSLPFRNPKNNRQEAANAFHMLDIITEALLEGNELDWSNSGQYKWAPYFNNYSKSSGFRFGNACRYWTFATYSGGARLFVDTEEKAKYLGTQFISIWNKLLNPIK